MLTPNCIFRRQFRQRLAVKSFIALSVLFRLPVRPESYKHCTHAIVEDARRYAICAGCIGTASVNVASVLLQALFQPVLCVNLGKQVRGLCDLRLWFWSVLRAGAARIHPSGPPNPQRTSIIMTVHATNVPAMTTRTPNTNKTVASGETAGLGLREEFTITTAAEPSD